MLKKVLVTRKELTEFALGVVDLVLEKNEKYRDSWQKHGIFTPLIRLTEKGVRLDESANKPVLIIDDEEDSIINNLDDIIGYALLAKIWLKYNRQYPEPNEWQLTFEDISENWLTLEEGSFDEFGVSPVLESFDTVSALRESYIQAMSRVFGVPPESIDIAVQTVTTKEKAADISKILDTHSKRVKDEDGNPI